MLRRTLALLCIAGSTIGSGCTAHIGRVDTPAAHVVPFQPRDDVMILLTVIRNPRVPASNRRPIRIVIVPRSWTGLKQEFEKASPPAPSG